MTFVLQVIINAISIGSLYALVALGIGLLFGILRLINFAHASYITIGAYAIIVPSTEDRRGPTAAQDGRDWGQEARADAVPDEREGIDVRHRRWLHCPQRRVGWLVG